jgi:hypothetical protein
MITHLIWGFSNVSGRVHAVDMKQSGPHEHTSVSAFTRVLAQLQASLAPVTGTPLGSAGDDELCALTIAVEEAGRLLDSLRVASAGEIADRSRRGLGADSLCTRLGTRDAAHLLESLTRVSPAEARRRVRIGRAVRPGRTLTGDPLPADHGIVADALAAGSIGIDSAAVIIHCLDDARDHASDRDIRVAEIALVESAVHCGADEVGVQSRAWREALDPDGAEPRDERLHRKRAFHLGRERDGLTPFSGHLEPVCAALLRSALAESDKPGNTPRFLSDDDRSNGTTIVSLDEQGNEQIEFVDARSRDQRHYDVVTGLLTAGVRASQKAPKGRRSTASITAVITLDDLRRATSDDTSESGTFGHTSRGGIGWLDGIDEPVSADTVAELVCSAGFAPLLLGDGGQILHLGRTRRRFTAAQVTALGARDGGCVNCGAPLSWCDAHHIVHWAAGGTTDIDNGVLLCRPCHRMIHHSDHRLGIIDGRPHVLAPPGLDPSQTWRPLRSHRVGILRAVAGGGP